MKKIRTTLWEELQSTPVGGTSKQEAAALAAAVTKVAPPKGRAEIDAVNKNREAMLVLDKDKFATLDDLDIWSWFEDAIEDLINDKIDTIVVTAKKKEPKKELCAVLDKKGRFKDIKKCE